MSKTAVAEDLGISRQHLDDIMNETKPISPDVAVRPGAAFGDGPEIWLRMQAAYDAGAQSLREQGSPPVGRLTWRPFPEFPLFGKALRRQFSNVLCDAQGVVIPVCPRLPRATDLSPSYAQRACAFATAGVLRLATF